MDQLNAVSTAVIALATLVATWSTWKLVGIERNREQASNGVYMWVTPDHFFILNGELSAGHRWLQLNARSTSNMPAFDVNVAVILDATSDDFPKIQKGEIVYSKTFPVLFEHGNQMNPVSLEADGILNPELRKFLSTPGENYDFKEKYEFLATHMRTEITFRDSHGVNWKRNMNGKLKRV
jgi:hypothetical protein